MTVHLEKLSKHSQTNADILATNEDAFVWCRNNRKNLFRMAQFTPRRKYNWAKSKEICGLRRVPLCTNETTVYVCILFKLFQRGMEDKCIVVVSSVPVYVHGL